MGGRTLAWKLSSRQSQEVLKALVNLQVLDRAAVDDFLDRFGHLIPKFKGLGEPPIPESKMRLVRIKLLSAGLQDVWNSTDQRMKEFAVFYIIRLVNSTGDPARLVGDWKLPPPTPFEDAVRHLNRARTHQCQNPECPAPYFFAKRKTQTYCSEDCAEYGQRQAKKRWWAAHGEAWRLTRQRRAKRRKK